MLDVRESRINLRRANDGLLQSKADVDSARVALFDALARPSHRSHLKQT